MHTLGEPHQHAASGLILNYLLSGKKPMNSRAAVTTARGHY